MKNLHTSIPAASSLKERMENAKENFVVRSIWRAVDLFHDSVSFSKNQYNAEIIKTLKKQGYTVTREKDTGYITVSW